MTANTATKPLKIKENKIPMITGKAQGEGLNTCG
jgi:hypothetical protein